MKKILVLMALVCAVLNVSAQEDSKWTAKVGLGIGTVAGSDTDGVESDISYKVGVGYEYAISESFAIEPAIMLNNKSFKYKGVSGTVNRYFLEVPVLAAYKINLNDNLKLIINAGPYAAYGIFGSDIEFIDGGKINVFDDKEGYNRFEAGIEAGAKVAFSNMTIGLDFSRAFTKCDDDFKQYSQVFGVTFGYKF